MKAATPQRAFNASLAVVGYVLSPLSWWNDMFVNVPLAYAFATPFALLHAELFLPAFALGYWLSNLGGFILLHRGLLGLFDKAPALQMRGYLLPTCLYTGLIALLTWLQWLPLPAELIEQIK